MTVHLVSKSAAACNQTYVGGAKTDDPAKVTCKSCRKTKAYTAALNQTIHLAKDGYAICNGNGKAQLTPEYTKVTCKHCKQTEAYKSLKRAWEEREECTPVHFIPHIKSKQTLCMKGVINFEESALSTNAEDVTCEECKKNAMFTAYSHIHMPNNESVDKSFGNTHCGLFFEPNGPTANLPVKADKFLGAVTCPKCLDIAYQQAKQTEGTTSHSAALVVGITEWDNSAYCAVRIVKADPALLKLDIWDKKGVWKYATDLSVEITTKPTGSPCSLNINSIFKPIISFKAAIPSIEEQIKLFNAQVSEMLGTAEISASTIERLVE